MLRSRAGRVISNQFKTDESRRVIEGKEQFEKKTEERHDARLMKVNNIVASKADKKHARPLYARLARVKQQIELLEIRDGLEVLPNLKLATIAHALIEHIYI